MPPVERFDGELFGSAQLLEMRAPQPVNATQIAGEVAGEKQSEVNQNRVECC
jgi:hypothetical protein